VFDRFTDGARRVVVLAQEEARLLDHNYGVLYIPFDAEGIWRYRLGRELRAAGIEVDLGNLP
jgi:myo-inositol-hexaphosphate 3-phosphohydrolase